LPGLGKNLSIFLWLGFLAASVLSFIDVHRCYIRKLEHATDNPLSTYSLSENVHMQTTSIAEVIRQNPSKVILCLG